ncbi:hypothetical protein CPB83DRAFT_855399, partial [Crepidotus variabilis]
MVLVQLPPADSPETRPQYFMTVALKLFMPLSHITTLYRRSETPVSTSEVLS